VQPSQLKVDPPLQAETPAFMSVGTMGAVRNMASDEVKEAGTEILLSNTFHLMLRPGTDVIEAAGDLHDFMRWDGPILTDSGGFQVMSPMRLTVFRASVCANLPPPSVWAHHFHPCRHLHVLRYRATLARRSVTLSQRQDCFVEQPHNSDIIIMNNVFINLFRSHTDAVALSIASMTQTHLIYPLFEVPGLEPRGQKGV
jgi:tRNA-guanine family transglycosylase